MEQKTKQQPPRMQMQCIICKTKYSMETDGPAKQNCPICLSWHSVNLTRGETITIERQINIYKFLLRYGITEDRLLSGIPERTLESAMIHACPRCKEKGINTYYTTDMCPKCNYKCEKKEEPKKEAKEDGHHKAPQHSTRHGAKGQREDGTVDETGRKCTPDIEDTSLHNELPRGQEKTPTPVD
jgi:hypothetical protein